MTIDCKIFQQVWPIFQVWWVLGYVRAVKNSIIWDKQVVSTKTIGTSQVKTCDEQALAVHTHRCMLLSGRAAYPAPLTDYCVSIYYLSVFQTVEEGVKCHFLCPTCGALTPWLVLNKCICMFAIIHFNGKNNLSHSVLYVSHKLLLSALQTAAHYMLSPFLLCALL